MKQENTATRLQEIMKSRNLRQVDILELARPLCEKYEVKLNKSDLSQYVSGKVEPGQDKLFILGRALNVSETWLMGYDVPMDRPTASARKTPYTVHCETKEECDLVLGYRELNAENKRKLDRYGKTLLRIQTMESEVEQSIQALQATADRTTAKVIPLRQSLQSVSAGTGAYLGPEEFETIFVEENDLTSRASFAVPVRGNSMEPRYHDGDVLLVEGKQDINIGQIGVFTVNGEGFVKERGGDVLHSLNPDYDDVALTDNSWCNGLVIGVLNPNWIK